MEVGHWIAIGVPVSAAVGGCVVKLVRLFGRVTKLEELAKTNTKAHKKNDQDHGRLEGKQDIGLVALRELLVALDLRKPGEGINGEDQ